MTPDRTLQFIWLCQKISYTLDRRLRKLKTRGLYLYSVPAQLAVRENITRGQENQQVQFYITLPTYNCHSQILFFFYKLKVSVHSNNSIREGQRSSVFGDERRLLTGIHATVEDRTPTAHRQYTNNYTTTNTANASFDCHVRKHTNYWVSPATSITLPVVEVRARVPHTGSATGCTHFMLTATVCYAWCAIWRRG